jgi:hypothetical protein
VRQRSFQSERKAANARSVLEKTHFDTWRGMRCEAAPPIRCRFPIGRGNLACTARAVLCHPILVLICCGLSPASPSFSRERPSVQ